MRAKFYREHKYVSPLLNDLERLIAKTDFRDNQEIETAKKEWEDALNLLKAHAAYEEENLHPLLEKKNSKVHLHAHDEHEKMESTFLKIDSLFEEALKESDLEKKLEKGFELYLTFRKFVGENLVHLHEEETKILPELQRLYTDEELISVKKPTYRAMTLDQMVEMLERLFPYMNPSDKEAYLQEIKFLEPEKFKQIEDRVTALLV